MKKNEMIQQLDLENWSYIVEDTDVSKSLATLTQRFELAPLSAEQVARLCLVVSDISSDIACELDEDDEETRQNIVRYIDELQRYLDKLVTSC